MNPTFATTRRNRMIDLYSIRRATVAAFFAVMLAAYGARPASAVIPNEAICTAPNLQMSPSAVSNGAGGALVTWADSRWGDLDIYLQQTNGLAQPVWTTDGIPVCKISSNQQFPRVVSDGTGGAIVTWQDQRGLDQDIWAQRVSSTGVVVWTVGGLPICSSPGVQERPQIVADGAGGAVILWVDHRAGTADVYAQRVDASGNVLWLANGVPLCSATGAQTELAAISDGWGGAIVAWKDARGGNADVYAQRVNATGLPVWTLDGVAVSAAADLQETPVLATDGSFGAIVAWEDRRTGDWNVYAQRVAAASGAAQWAANGVAVCAATGDQTVPNLVSDGGSGAIVTWEDRRGANADVYAQRMTGAGGASWTANGISVCAETADQTGPSISSDDLGGAVIAWSDLRTGANGYDIYAQRLSSAGTGAWAANGVALCDTLQTQDAAVAVSDGEGGAIVTWSDSRAVTQTDVFAQRVDAGGLVLGLCPATTTALTVNTQTTASSAYNYYDVPVGLTLYWGGVGVRPSNGSDWDVEWYPGQSYGLAPYPICFANPMAGSAGSSGVDFAVASFESNRTPANSTYGARVSRFAGSGTAAVEYDLLAQTLNNNCTGGCTGTTVSSWSGVLNVYDVRLTQGTTYTFDFLKSGTGDLKLLLLTSQGLTGPYVAGRGDAVSRPRTATWSTPLPSRSGTASWS